LKTVFAPSDEAFAKLPEGTLANLTNEQKKEILYRHVLYDVKVLAEDIGFDAVPVQTLGKEFIEIGAENSTGQIQIEYMGSLSSVVTPDVMASNGVIHVIDKVILPGDLVEVAIAAGNFKTLVQIIVDLDLVEQFKGKTPQTVFAPSDEAFAKLPEGTLANLTDRQKAYILFRHVLYNVTVLGADIEIGPLKTLNGEVIDIIIEDNTGEDVIQIEYKGSLSSVVTADVMASNGVIHVIDNVILPAEPPLGDVVDVAIAAGNFKTLVQILTDLRLVPRLKSYKAQTIFAPSDEAFAKLPEGTLGNLTNQQKFEIVARHVVGNVTVLEADVEIGPLTTLGGEVIDIFTDNSGEDVIQIEYKGSLSTVVTADVMASNGVIHVIDNVILPAEPPLGNVVDVAIAAGNFKTLVQIIVDLNLVDVLVRQKAQTIFAPSDEAFAKLPKGLLETLTKEQKIEIVARHVVPNITVPKADVETGPLKTLGGEVIDIIVITNAVNTIQIEYKGSSSSVVTADVMASNGVIHVIDNVILPGPTTTTKITTTAPPPTPILPGLNLCFPQEFDFNARSAEPISQLNIVICGENEVCQPIGDGELGKYG
jgi:uncharacterized surface protein with fasciclin (FAS1) repeats